MKSIWTDRHGNAAQRIPSINQRSIINIKRNVYTLRSWTNTTNHFESKNEGNEFRQLTFGELFDRRGVLFENKMYVTKSDQTRMYAVRTLIILQRPEQ